MNTRNTLKVNNYGRLEIGGLDVNDIVKEFGTPLYVMDKKHIKDMCATYTNSLKDYYGNGMISYASKAFCCKEIYRIINDFGMGADVVSIGELKTALSVNFPTEKLIFHGNNKSFSDLNFAIDNNIGLIVVDSLSEAEDIQNICKRKNIKQNVLIRINPGVEAHTHHYIQTANPDSKFGFSIATGDAYNSAKYISKFSNVNIKGFHCHIGSQIFEKKSFLIAVDKMTDFYVKVKNELNIDCEIINLGGGFGIYYANGDSKLSLEDYANYVKQISISLKDNIAKKGLSNLFLILEPGRSIVGEAGITLYSSGRIKKIPKLKNYIAINGGMFDNPRFALYQAKYSVVAAQKMNEKPTINYTIAGKCCESGDIIAEDCCLPEIFEGDILAVLSTGAYNYSMSSNYNRNVVPPVIMVENGKGYYAVKPQTDEDILRNDI